MGLICAVEAVITVGVKKRRKKIMGAKSHVLQGKKANGEVVHEGVWVSMFAVK